MLNLRAIRLLNELTNKLFPSGCEDKLLDSVADDRYYLPKSAMV